MKSFVQTDRTNSGDEAEPVVENNKEKYCRDERKISSGLFFVADDGVGSVVEKFDDIFKNILYTRRDDFHLVASDCRKDN